MGLEPFRTCPAVFSLTLRVSPYPDLFSDCFDIPLVSHQLPNPSSCWLSMISSSRRQHTSHITQYLWRQCFCFERLLWDTQISQPLPTKYPLPAQCMLLSQDRNSPCLQIYPKHKQVLKGGLQDMFCFLLTLPCPSRASVPVSSLHLEYLTMLCLAGAGNKNQDRRISSQHKSVTGQHQILIVLDRSGQILLQHIRGK